MFIAVDLKLGVLLRSSMAVDINLFPSGKKVATFPSAISNDCIFTASIFPVALLVVLTTRAAQPMGQGC